MGLFKRLFKKIFNKKQVKQTSKLTINKHLPVGVSKVDHYIGLVQQLINKAQELDEDEIILSPEFTPILCFADVEREPQPYTGMEYLYGAKDDIKFYISPKYSNGGKVGKLPIELTNYE